jgi:quercetin dioxygenase-like cupin family protein
MGIRIYDTERDGTPMPNGPALPAGSRVKMMVWPGVGATTGSLHFVKCDAGFEGAPHVHETADDIGYIIEGAGFMLEWRDGVEVDRYPFRAGDVLYVQPGTWHSHVATTDCVIVGGPCPPDPDTYRSFGMTW